MSGSASAGRVRPADSVHARIFAGELVILDMERGEYFAMDEIGATLWAGVQAGKTLEQIAEDVVAHYDVPLPQALTDLAALRNELLERGLLVQEGGESR